MKKQTKYKHIRLFHKLRREGVSNINITSLSSHKEINTTHAMIKPPPLRSTYEGSMERVGVKRETQGRIYRLSVRSENLGVFRERDRWRSSPLRSLLLSIDFGLSLQPLVFRLSRSGLGDHSLQLSSLEVCFIWLRPLEDSAKRDQTLGVVMGRRSEVPVR